MLLGTSQQVPLGLVGRLVDKRPIPQFISSPLPDLGTKLVDLPVQFPWPIGTNGAEKLGLASRSGGRPTSYWAASLKGVMSRIVAAEVQGRQPSWPGRFLSAQSSEDPNVPRTTSMAASYL